jgi:hypothetical protein
MIAAFSDCFPLVPKLKLLFGNMELIASVFLEDRVEEWGQRRGREEDQQAQE